MSDSLWHYGLQHTRFPCPSPIPRVCSNSCPLSWWCHPTISSSVVPFSSCFQSSPASGSLPMSWLFASGGQSIEALASVLPMTIKGWLPLGLTGWSWSLRNSQESSPAPQFKSISSSTFSLLYGSGLTSVHDYWQNHSFDYMDLCRQINLSAFLICCQICHTFSSNEQASLISWLQSLSTVILEHKKIQSDTVFTFSHLFAMKWWD